MGKKKKSILADSIDFEETHYNLRALSRDITAAIIEDKTLKKEASLYCMLYMHIIRMLALGHDNKIIIYSINEPKHMHWPEEKIIFHISRVQSNYKEFVEIMEAIFHAKFNDFVKLGASDEVAFDCCNEWIESQFS